MAQCYNLKKIFDIKKNQKKSSEILTKLIDFLVLMLMKIQNKKIYVWAYGKYLYFDESLENIVKKNSLLDYSSFSRDFVANLCEVILGKKRDKNSESSFVYYFEIDEFDCILKKLNENMLIDLSNILLEIIFSLSANGFGSKIIFDPYKFEIKNFNMEEFKLIIDILNSFLISFDEKKKILIKINEKLMLENINNETLDSIIYEYKKSNKFLEKYKTFSFLAKEYIYPILNNSKFKEWMNILKIYFSNGFINNLKNECNGYFRHSINDSGKTQKTEEWEKLSDEEKISVMNKTLITYLFIFSILTDHGKDINKLNKDSKNE